MGRRKTNVFLTAKRMIYWNTWETNTSLIQTMSSCLLVVLNPTMRIALSSWRMLTIQLERVSAALISHGPSQCQVMISNRGTLRSRNLLGVDNVKYTILLFCTVQL